MTTYFIWLRLKSGNEIEISLRAISRRHAEFRALLVYPESSVIALEVLLEVRAAA